HPILCGPQSVGEHLLHQAQSQEPCHWVPLVGRLGGTHDASPDQKRALDPLELELWMVLSTVCTLETTSWSFGRAA
ncbi:hypothetical protein STEG23_023804, partial [Scotinomys teguina]